MSDSDIKLYYLGLYQQEIIFNIQVLNYLAFLFFIDFPVDLIRIITYYFVDISIPINSKMTVSVGCNYSYLLKNGRLYSCGENKLGQLGLGDTMCRNEFIEMDVSDVIAVSCGSYHSLVLTKKGLFACGSNGAGNLGICSYLDKELLTKCTFSDNNCSNIIKFGCGYRHSLVLTKSNGLLGCGQNYNGQLGFKERDKQCIFLPLLISDVISMACGGYHSLVLRKEGLYGCGSNDSGQLAGLYSEIRSFTKLDIQLGPGHKVISMTCSRHSSFVLTSEGLFACGDNTDSRLGLNKSNRNINEFTKVNISNVISLSCNSDYTMILTTEGLYACGIMRNEKNGVPLLSWTKLKLTNIKNVITFGCGEFHCTILTKDGVYSGGGNEFCQTRRLDKDEFIRRIGDIGTDLKQYCFY